MLNPGGPARNTRRATRTAQSASVRDSVPSHPRPEFPDSAHIIANGAPNASIGSQFTMDSNTTAQHPRADAFATTRRVNATQSARRTNPTPQQLAHPALGQSEDSTDPGCIHTEHQQNVRQGGHRRNTMTNTGQTQCQDWTSFWTWYGQDTHEHEAVIFMTGFATLALALALALTTNHVSYAAEVMQCSWMQALMHDPKNYFLGFVWDLIQCSHAISIVVRLCWAFDHRWRFSSSFSRSSRVYESQRQFYLNNARICHDSLTALAAASVLVPAFLQTEHVDAWWYILAYSIVRWAQVVLGNLGADKRLAEISLLGIVMIAVTCVRWYPAATTGWVESYKYADNYRQYGGPMGGGLLGQTQNFSNNVGSAQMSSTPLMQTISDSIKSEYSVTESANLISATSTVSTAQDGTEETPSTEATLDAMEILDAYLAQYDEIVTEWPSTTEGLTYYGCGSYGGWHPCEETSDPSPVPKIEMSTEENLDSSSVADIGTSTEEILDSSSVPNIDTSIEGTPNPSPDPAIEVSSEATATPLSEESSSRPSNDISMKDTPFVAVTEYQPHSEQTPFSNLCPERIGTNRYVISQNRDMVTSFPATVTDVHCTKGQPPYIRKVILGGPGVSYVLQSDFEAREAYGQGYIGRMLFKLLAWL